MISKLPILLFLVCFSISGNAQLNFSFEKLEFYFNNKKIAKSEVYLHENVDVKLSDIEGLLYIDGYASLGMEIVITDKNSNRLLFSPDMLSGVKLSEDDVQNLKFHLELTEEFKEGEEYFVKIKLWDKVGKRSHSKHASFKVKNSLKNQHAYIDVRRLKLSGYKVYLNGDRLYKTNYFRNQDDLVVDLFFYDFKYVKKDEVLVFTKIIDEQENKTYELSNEFALAEKSEKMTSILVRNRISHFNLLHGNEYIFHLQVHNSERNQKLDFKFKFVFQSDDWRRYELIKGKSQLGAFLNQEKIGNSPTVEIGDRFDFKLHGFQKHFQNDFGFGKIGANIALFNHSGELIFESHDLYKDFGVFSVKDFQFVEYNYTVPHYLKRNERFYFQFNVWDKYGNAYTTRRFDFKTAKKAAVLGGVNPNIDINFQSEKLDLIASYAFRNGYKEEGNYFKLGDELSVLTAYKIKDSVKLKNTIRYTKLFDAKGELLSIDEEEIEVLQGGEFESSIVIPEFGVSFGEKYRIVTLVKEADLEILRVEYTFVITN